MKKWQEKIRQYGVCVISCLFLFGMPVWYLVDKDEKISIKEQRSLQQLPHFQMSAFLEKTFQKELEQYMMDQLPQRQTLFTTQVKLSHLLGKQQFSNVWIGKDEWLFQETIMPSKDEMQKRSDVLRNFCKRYPKMNMRMMLVCNKAEIYPTYLPVGANKVDQEKLIQQFYKQIKMKNVKTLDVCTILKQHQKEYLYYATDHHWTTQGAYLAFQEFHKTFLKKEPPISYKSYVIADTFQGALTKTSGYQSQLKDKVSVYLPTQKSVDTIVTYVEEQKKTASVYAYEKVNSVNPYEVFFGGNHPLMEIQTSAANERSLLVFKDSFANAYLPFLLPYYHNITVVDPRYYYDDINSLIKERNISEVLFLYNANTFFQDISFLELLS